MKDSGVYGVMMITSSTTLAMATGFVYFIIPRPHPRREQAGQRKHSQRSKVSFVCNPKLAFRSESPHDDGQSIQQTIPRDGKKY